jgi:hypothetical protein
VVLAPSLIPGKYSSEFKLVSVSDAGPASLNRNPDAMISDTTEDDDLNRAWAALSQRQRNRLRQVKREWISEEKHFLRTNKTNLPRSEPAISVPWWTKIKSNSRRLRLICKKSHCQASVIPNIAHLIRDDPPPTWEETFVTGFEEAAIDQQGRPLIVF